MGWWDKRLIDQVSDIPSIIFSFFNKTSKMKTKSFECPNSIKKYIWKNELYSNIASYNLIDTKHCQIAFQSPSDCTPIRPYQWSFRTPGQTKVIEWWLPEGDNPWSLMFNSQMIGISDACLPSHLSQQTSKPNYILDCQISGLRNCLTMRSHCHHHHHVRFFSASGARTWVVHLRNWGEHSVLKLD